MADDLYEGNVPPPPSGSPFWKPAHHKDQLHLFVISHTGMENAFGEEQEHLYGMVYVLTGPNAGEEYELKSRNRKLVGQLKGFSGKRVARRLRQQQTSQGNPAWVVETDLSEQDAEIAKRFLKGEAPPDEVPF